MCHLSVTINHMSPYGDMSNARTDIGKDSLQQVIGVTAARGATCYPSASENPRNFFEK
jgi:hypothetical protein